jgi:hypothetical protein
MTPSAQTAAQMATTFRRIDPPRGWCAGEFTLQAERNVLFEEKRNIPRKGICKLNPSAHFLLAAFPHDGILQS